MKRQFRRTILISLLLIPVWGTAEPMATSPAVIGLLPAITMVEQSWPQSESSTLALPPIEGQGTRILRGSQYKGERLAPPPPPRTLLEKSRRWLGVEW